MYLLFVQGKAKGPAKSNWRSLINVAVSKLSLPQSNPNDRIITHNLTDCDTGISALERPWRGILYYSAKPATIEKQSSHGGHLRFDTVPYFQEFGLGLKWTMTSRENSHQFVMEKY